MVVFPKAPDEERRVRCGAAGVDLEVGCVLREVGDVLDPQCLDLGGAKARRRDRQVLEKVVAAGGEDDHLFDATARLGDGGVFSLWR